mgnify:CR=1 FL=1
MKKIIPLFFTLLTFIACKKQSEYKLDDFEITLNLNLNNDIGLDGGTLFEAYDEYGNLLAYAGFNNGINTRSSINRKILSFYVKPHQDSVLITDIDNPFPGIDECGRIFNVNNELWALNYKHEKKKYNSDLKQWEEIKNLKLNSIEYLIDIQKLQDSIVWVHVDGVFWGNKPLYREKLPEYRIITFYVNNENVLIFRTTDDTLHNCRNLLSIGKLNWKNNQPEIKIDTTYQGLCPLPWLAGAYCWAYQQNHFYISTNSGHTYKLNSDSLVVITERDIYDFVTEGWQAYSMINFRNKLLLGHYPSGKIFEINNNQIDTPLYIYNVPVRDDILAQEREVQTMAVYAGYLMCGLWPWGEVYGFDLNLNKWSFYQRFFQFPGYRKELTPFYDRIQFNSGIQNNQWGQRVTDLVPYGKYLAVNTSFKNVVFEDDKKYLFTDEINQYGKVYLMEIPGQISSVINWKQETELKFICKNGVMQIYQDGELMAENKIDALDKRVDFQIMPHSGILGKSNYRLVSHKIR